MAMCMAQLCFRGSGTPSGLLDHPTRLPGGRSGQRRNDDRLPSANPAGWAQGVSSVENVQPADRRYVPAVFTIRYRVWTKN